MYSEFNKHVECPHCGHEEYETFEFDMHSADQSGVNSEIRELECGNYEGECGKKFWTRARLNFDVDITDTWLKKPKNKTDPKMKKAVDAFLGR